MTRTPPAVERAMRMQEIIVRALSGELSWGRAAEILGLSARSVRRWRRRYEHEGYDGLWDRRYGGPSPRRAPLAEVERVLHLYRETYRGFNVRHFHELVRREHGVTQSYSFVKQLLQQAGLVAKRRPWGRHFHRRPPRPCFGELLHLDGSRHPWLALCPTERSTLIAVVDDATRALRYAHLGLGETTAAVFAALRHVLETDGLPLALYTDRAGWAAHTPRAGGRVSRRHLTQVGRALRQLGIEHILAYSPQARGRGERVNRTLQDRLVNELRVAGITTLAAANQYLRERFVPAYNATFRRPPADPASAFVAVGRADLDQILCIEVERTVGKDNTVVMGGVRLQVTQQPGRPTCAGLRVTIRHHLDRTYTVWWGRRRLGHYDPAGLALRPGRGVPDPPAKRTDHVSNLTGQITC